MTHVAYKGTSASVTDLAGGHIELVIGGPAPEAAWPTLARSSCLAVTSEAPTAGLLPDVPAISRDLQGLRHGHLSGLMAPKGTPNRRNRPVSISEINAILSASGRAAVAGATGHVVVAGGSPADFVTQISARTMSPRGKIIHQLELSTD